MFKNLVSKNLKLAKTHDFCPSGQSELTLAFIHGIASDSSSFSKLIEYLEGTNSLKNVRFVAFDLLGAGKSPKSDKLNYDFPEQLEALDNSLNDLRVKTPLILVGHSMGCLISARYADTHKSKVKGLILISPPIYRPEDFDNPIFTAGQENFKKIIFQKYRGLKDDKAFHSELENIVMNKKNYAVFARLTKPTTIIYGVADQIIASFNIPGLLSENKKITAVQTPGAHGITNDKYAKMVAATEGFIK